jgi:hypothetical protein
VQAQAAGQHAQLLGIVTANNTDAQAHPIHPANISGTMLAHMTSYTSPEVLLQLAAEQWL